MARPSDVGEDADHRAMRALDEGQDRALDEIMGRWREKILAYLYRLTGDREAAMDLGQETFVRVYRARTSYRAKGPFSTWLFAIATNLARNHARWRARHPETELSANDEQCSGEPTPALAAANAEQAEAVRQAIRNLSGDLREALVLTFYHEMSHADAAATLGCSSKAVENRVHRARERLKLALREWHLPA